MADSRTVIQARYDSKNRKSFAVKLNKNYDSDIINKLESVESINGYIRQLIRDDITRTGSVPEGTQARTVVIYEPIGTPPVPKTEKKEGITMKRTYGSTRTHLTLEGKALEFYNMTDPIRIEETEEDGEFTYQVFSGNEPMHDGVMTEEKLIKWLEDGYDEYMNV